jgi:hypothetical protein
MWCFTRDLMTPERPCVTLFRRVTPCNTEVFAVQTWHRCLQLGLRGTWISEVQPTSTFQ